MKKFSFSRRGFTLLELLVVISIIGILVALATVSYSSAQASARDSRRRSDITGIRNAMEQYYSENNAYPTSCSTSSLNTSLSTFLPSGVPLDPETSSAYAVNSCTGTGTAYCVCALLDRAGTGNASNATCTMSTTGNYYCARNLQ